VVENVIQKYQQAVEASFGVVVVVIVAFRTLDSFDSNNPFMEVDVQAIKVLLHWSKNPVQY
jgi:hypothetical protein